MARGKLPADTIDSVFGQIVKKGQKHDQHIGCNKIR
jgi:hypothetical protein